MGFILMVTVAWWTLALWSIPGAPEWLERTRSVCFNLSETGIPDRKGWLLLMGQPPTMLAVLVVGWRKETMDSLAWLIAHPRGRVTMIGVGTLLFTGLVLAGNTVSAARLPGIVFGSDEPAPETYPRLDRSWPEMGELVDQNGESFALASLGQKPAMVTFAFGHCVTLCPVVVHQARAARLELQRDVSIVVFTLDPWRDTPNRLQSLVTQFDLDPDRDFVVSGSVESVNAALDAWNMPRERDELTGDITHPGIVYMIEPDGTVAYGSTGGIVQMVSLAQRLR
jgi:cytochrome oxidase Cu insertion factor (SCO1/SenC/PrrC family)